MTKRQFAFNFVLAVCALFSLTTLHAQNHSLEFNGAHVYVAVAEDASLNINNDCAPTSGSSTITACDDYVWNGMLLTESGVYEYITTNSNGCDSTHTYNLTVNESTSGTDIQESCDEFTWIDGVTYTESTDSATFVLIKSLSLLKD